MSNIELNAETLVRQEGSNAYGYISAHQSGRSIVVAPLSGKFNGQNPIEIVYFTPGMVSGMFQFREGHNISTQFRIRLNGSFSGCMNISNIHDDLFENSTEAHIREKLGYIHLGHEVNVTVMFFNRMKISITLHFARTWNPFIVDFIEPQYSNCSIYNPPMSITVIRGHTIKNMIRVKLMKQMLTNYSDTS